MKKLVFTLFVFCYISASAQPWNYERSWATYFGDDSMRVTDNEVDKDGNIYIVGFIDKLNYFDSNFMTTPNVHQTTYGGGKRDGFIVKLSPAGQVLYSTYFGGENSDAITGMTIDRNDNIYIFGTTYSSNNISTPNSYQAVKNGNINNFIAKLSPTGNVLWSTYYGTPNDQEDFYAIDSQFTLAFDSADIVWADSGNLYLQSKNFSGMASPGAFQTNIIGDISTDLISKFTDGGQRVWATYYGINQSSVRGISVGSDGIYLGGLSKDCPPNGTYNTYFGTAAAFQEIPQTCRTQFLTKLSFNGERLWSTYYGNAQPSFMGKSSVVALGNSVYVVGSTSGAGALTTPGAFQESLSYPSNSNLLIKFNSSGQRQWATYVGDDLENSYASFGYPNLSSDQSQNIYVSNNNALLGNLATTGSYQENIAGSFDAFTVKFNANGERQWGTFYGGTGNEFTPLKTLVSGNDFYFVGMTDSTNGISSPGCYQSNYATNNYQSPSTSSPPTNIFIAKFTPVLSTKEFAKDQAIVVYPNPSTSILNIESKTGETISDISIYSVSGAKVAQDRGGKPMNTVSVVDLRTGIYFVKVQTENGVKTFKFVKK